MMGWFILGVIAMAAVVAVVIGVRRWWRWLLVHRQAPWWAEEFETHGEKWRG